MFNSSCCRLSSDNPGKMLVNYSYRKSEPANKPFEMSSGPTRVSIFIFNLLEAILEFMRNYIVILCLSSSSSRDGNDKKPFKQTRSSDYPQVSSSPSNQSYRRCTHGVPRAGRLIAATAPHNAAGSCCNHRKEKTALRELVVEKAIMKTTINSPMSFRRKNYIRCRGCKLGMKFESFCVGLFHWPFGTGPSPAWPLPQWGKANREKSHRTRA